jgi:hypothetical protein
MEVIVSALIEMDAASCPGFVGYAQHAGERRFARVFGVYYLDFITHIYLCTQYRRLQDV